jgi:hypothetical protein
VNRFDFCDDMLNMCRLFLSITNIIENDANRNDEHNRTVYLLDHELYLNIEHKQNEGKLKVSTNAIEDLDGMMRNLLVILRVLLLYDDDSVSDHR